MIAAKLQGKDAHKLSPPEIIDFGGYIHKAANIMFDLVTNLLDLNRIRFNNGQTVVEGELQFTRVEKGIRGNHVDYILHDIIQIDPLPRWLSFLHHIPDTTYYLAGAPRVSTDISEEIANLLHVDIAAIDKALARSSVAHNSG